MSSRMEDRYLREFGYTKSEFNELAKKNNTDVYGLAASFKTKGRFNIGAYNYYVTKVRESDGYDVSGCDPNLRVSGGIGELSEDDREYTIMFAKFAVEKHNQLEGTKLKFKDAVKATWQVVSGAMAYVTLEAIDEQDDDMVKVYRAKVWYHPHLEKKMGAEMSLREFYLAPPPVKEERKPGKKRKILSGTKKSLSGTKRKTVSETKQKSLSGPKRKTRSETKQKSLSRTKQKSLSGTKRKSLSGTKRPFNIFVEDLRKLPEFECERYVDVLRIAGTKWRSMLDEEKAYYEKRARSGSVGVECQAQAGLGEED